MRIRQGLVVERDGQSALGQGDEPVRLSGGFGQEEPRQCLGRQQTRARTGRSEDQGRRDEERGRLSSQVFQRIRCRPPGADPGAHEEGEYRSQDLFLVARAEGFALPAIAGGSSFGQTGFNGPNCPLFARTPCARCPVRGSGDPTQEYFSDGITEEIITGLSKIPRLIVIARNSTFTYKGKPVKVQDVGRELGVRYVLEGSVRWAGDRVRITAQLIDAATGHHLWAERYDREMKDIFALQDEITIKIIVAMQVKLTEGEQARMPEGKGTRNLDSYLKLLEGISYAHRFNIEGNTLARRMAEEVIALSPDDPGGYSLLAVTHVMDYFLGYAKSPERSVEKAFELTQKALALDDTSAQNHGLLSHLYSVKREHDKAVAEGERAVTLDPGGADVHAWLGQSLMLVDGISCKALTV